MSMPDIGQDADFEQVNHAGGPARVFGLIPTSSMASPHHGCVNSV